MYRSSLRGALVFFSYIFSFRTTLAYFKILLKVMLKLKISFLKALEEIYVVDSIPQRLPCLFKETIGFQESFFNRTLNMETA